MLFGLILCIIPISCQKEESISDKPKGSLIINIGLFISVNEVDKSLKSTTAAEDFKVTIFNTNDEEVLSFERAADMPEVIELETGQYYVTASSENNLPAAFENPYYFGESELFPITPGGQQTIAVNCELANTMVTIKYADNVKSNYSDYSTTVSSSTGSLLFTKDEIRPGFFQPLPLNISASLTWQKDDGSYESKILSGSIPSPQAKKHYEIHIDAAAAGGSALFQITVDENAEPVEIVQITDNGTPSSGAINSGDLLITEIMYDPDILTDSEGEWFEIYNTTNIPVDLHQIVIRKNDTEYHIVNSEIILPSHGYYVFARNEAATTAQNKYLYNTAITMNNTGAILSLANYGTDGTDGSIIISVNYGDEGFPSATGASLSLSSGRLNSAEAVLGNSWCVSATAYNTGDFGTPGLPNANCP
jgi:hypothetical protein